MWQGIRQSLHVHIKNDIDVSKYNCSAYLYQPGNKINIDEYISSESSGILKIDLPEEITKQIEPPFVSFQLYLTDADSKCVYTHKPIKITVRKSLKIGDD